MKIYIAFIFVVVLSEYSCQNSSLPNNKPHKDDSSGKFGLINTYPAIMDTAVFIQELKETFDLSIENTNLEIEVITAFQKVKVFGSNETYYLIEYDYKIGSGAGYPWKYQLVLDETGKLIQLFSAQRCELVEVFPNENPFLLILNVTYKGNGYHELYVVQADTLENVLESDINTYDIHEDMQIYRPGELTLTINDWNKDGVNDLSFKGNIIFLSGITDDGLDYDVTVIDGKSIPFTVDNPFKVKPVELIFLYNEKTKHFSAKEDYSGIRSLP